MYIHIAHSLRSCRNAGWKLLLNTKDIFKFLVPPACKLPPWQYFISDIKYCWVCGKKPYSCKWLVGKFEAGSIKIPLISFHISTCSVNYCLRKSDNFLAISLNNNLTKNSAVKLNSKPQLGQGFFPCALSIIIIFIQFATIPFQLKFSKKTRLLLKQNGQAWERWMWDCI